MVPGNDNNRQADSQKNPRTRRSSGFNEAVVPRSSSFVALRSCQTLSVRIAPRRLVPAAVCPYCDFVGKQCDCIGKQCDCVGKQCDRVGASLPGRSQSLPG
jgi:hypothetical protein